jgi:ribose transport system substrate-binding protein
VVTAYAVLTDQSVPTAIGTGFTVMDASNIDDPEIRKFVYSD